MAYEHPSGIATAFDRARGRPEWQSVVFSGERLVQAAEMNEQQTIARGRHDRLGALVAKDGDRVEGAAAVVQSDLENVILTAGRIYLRGDVFPVAQAVLSGVPMTGTYEIGVRVVTEWVTHEDDPDLLGLVPGSLGEGEPGAAREVVTISWALEGGAEPGDFVPVYRLVDGTIIDQTPPPSLSGINQAVAIYDRDAHGSYIVRGCRVTALGKTGADQIFAIEEGVANIQGFKRTREAALRHAEPETWDLGTVDGEARTHPGGASPIFTVARSPIATVTNVLVTKEVTTTVTRGGTAGGSDLLPNTGVTQIMSVSQGGTTYVEGTDYVRTGDRVDWFPAGAEPAGGSSYTVTFRYLDSVTPTAVTPTTIQVSGGVTGTLAILSYTYKLPRIDLLCLDQAGQSVYVKGVSADENPLPPIAPISLLPLAEISNNWVGAPEVVNNGVRALPFAELWRVYNRVSDLDRLMQLERIRNAIDAREPVAKKGTFVDPLTDDSYRDAGEEQTAAVGDGVIQLAIDPTFYLADLNAPVMLEWVEEIVAGQERATQCLKINPYQNFTPLPGSLSLSPAADFWIERDTIWLSPRTVEFNRGVRRDDGPLTVTSSQNRVEDQRRQQLDFLRQIAIAYTVRGFGAGEILASITFDGVNVLSGPAPVANASGVLTGTFTIPAKVTAGTKLVEVVGAGGTKASALFVGQGVVETTVMRRVTTIERWRREQGESGNRNPVDPLAQTFSLAQPRQILGVDVRFCNIGTRSNAVLVQQRTVETGLPTSDVVAEAFVDMNSPVVDAWTPTRYPLPVLTGTEAEHAFVVLTDDANHAVSTAKLGDFDAASQSYVSAQPYSVGVLLASSNASTWTPRQDEDMAFRLVAARYPDTTRVVNLGSFDLVDASDLQVRATVELPSSACSVVFEIVRPGGGIWRLLPYQVLKLTEYVTETVQLRAVLTGTETLSPTLFAPVMLVAGKIRTSGSYITRAFKLGSDVRLTAYFKARLPAGSSVAVSYDLADDSWSSLPLAATEALSDPAWVEQKREAASLTGTVGRIRITITGGPGARPEIGDLGAAVM